MNTAQMEGDWEEAKGKIEAKWGEMTDHGLDVTAGNRDVVDGKLHELFEMTREQAEKAIADWDERKRN
jgi:uncharacterized protein YjbJ (UPF0337 family)